MSVLRSLPAIYENTVRSAFSASVIITERITLGHATFPMWHQQAFRVQTRQVSCADFLTSFARFLLRAAICCCFKVYLVPQRHSLRPLCLAALRHRRRPDALSVWLDLPKDAFYVLPGLLASFSNRETHLLYVDIVACGTPSWAAGKGATGTVAADSFLSVSVESFLLERPKLQGELLSYDPQLGNRATFTATLVLVTTPVF
jgi:hypothetical protein